MMITHDVHHRKRPADPDKLRVIKAVLDSRIAVPTLDVDAAIRDAARVLLQPGKRRAAGPDKQPVTVTKSFVESVRSVVDSVPQEILDLAKDGKEWRAFQQRRGAGQAARIASPPPPTRPDAAGNIRDQHRTEQLRRGNIPERDWKELASTFDGGAAVQVCASEVCGSDLCLMMNWSAVRLTAEGS